MPSTVFSIKKGIALCAAGIIVAAVAACSDMPVWPVSEGVATTSAGYGRAFGRVVFVQDGKEKTWGTGVLTMGLQLYVRSVRTGLLHVREIKGDGSFLWPLEAGDHVIVAFRSPGGEGIGRLWTTFTIPQPGQAAYIGELRIEDSKSLYRFAVEDRYAEALQEIESRLAEGKFVAVRSLMRPEEKLGTYREVWGICAERGGLKCDRSYQGVEPLQPARATQGYPTTPTLAPLLEWRPSSKEGITYDVAVFESLTLTIDGPGAPRARGALVSYTEGLREPRLQLTTPLQPGKKYDWSVRLRDGDTVSTWSVSSFFVFFIVGWAGGHGQWFGLSTPSN